MSEDDETMIMGCRLVRTCYACPEQYDVFDGDRMIGYLRLRHGSFTAIYGNPGGVEVYRARPEGDGIFDPDERDGFLAEAVRKLMLEDRR